MAKQILQEQPETLSAVPGLADLLVDADSGRDPDRIAQAAVNVRKTILDGLAAVGKALAIATNEESIELQEVAAIGWLVGELGEFAERLSFIHSDALHVASTKQA